MAKEKLTKLDVATRQMNEAIILFFEERDVVSIHTLAAASAQVLADLCRKKGISNFGLRDKTMIKPEFHELHRKAVKTSEQFFKHADQEPADAVHDYDPMEAEAHLTDTVMMYQKLSAPKTYECGAFEGWLSAKHPEWLVDGELKDQWLAATEDAGLGKDSTRQDWLDFIRMKDNILALRRERGLD